MDGRELGLAQLRGTSGDCLENRLHVARRAADDGEHLGRCRLMFQRFAQIVRALTQLLEQPRILDRDDGLGGEVRDQRDLLFAEWAHLLTVDADHAY